MKEMEYKTLITTDEATCVFKKLTRKNAQFSQYIQINYYYDDKWKLHNANETLRIRHKEEQLTLQHKTNKIYTDVSRICDEYEKEIKQLMPRINPSKDIEEKLINHNFILLGDMVTERTDFSINNCLVSLDKNIYLGCVDYELEIEYVHEQELISFFNMLWGGPRVTNKLGKYKRFAKKYKALFEAS